MKKSLAPASVRAYLLQSQRQMIEKRYGRNFSFYDPESKFCLDMHGLSTFDSPEHVVTAFEPAVQRARAAIEKIESGKITNKTKVVEESENRAVDHYNHRMVDSPVPGKSLADSIAKWEEVKDFAEKLKAGAIVNEAGERYTDVIFNGIGGSYLGPYMLILALCGRDFNHDRALRIHFLSNTDPDAFGDLLKTLDLSRIILVSMSKSGSTKETYGNMLAFRDVMEASGLVFGRHLVAITVAGSSLDKIAADNAFLARFHMHPETGGRVSICSAIGMLPAACAGIDFAQFLRGMSHMDALTRRADTMSNPAFLLSLGIEQQRRMRGRQNMVMLAYSDALLELPHYLQQLYMESLGKEYDIDGAPCADGLTVFGGVGTGEQHAFMQQIQKGIPDALVRFVYFRNRAHDFPLAEMPPHGTTMGRQFLAFQKGTEMALMMNGRDFITTVFDRCDAFNVGMIVALEERVVTVLAAMHRINAYDQPGVQDGKVSAKDFEVLAHRVEEGLRALRGQTVEGDVIQVATRLGFSCERRRLGNIYMLDAILMDICYNWRESWHLELEDTSFEFVDGRFNYKFTIKR
eukprot:gnl/Chilomastix_cuspidata/272.p1 GENE.gnl/Chilomastix_cuspidata/272~~gnl/Chilomastix_cuspidata/272.p1  ORF type:complete len:576 (-),score=285.33 gnl/Chilomastix_cuspidata/272:597-2324(-)